MFTWDSTTWIAVGAFVAVAVLLVAVLVLARRLPRGESADAGAVERARREARRAWEETRRLRADAARARSELRWMRRLAVSGGSGSLDDVLRRSLEAAAGLASASAALIVLPREGEEPLVASAGLSAEERSRELLGLPPGGSEARAVSLSYRYTDDDGDDEFRLTGGIAIPVVDPAGGRVATLAVFWRRAEHDVTDEELGHLEGLAGALGPALTVALRVERLRLELDVDPLTGLGGRSSLLRGLALECERARRYSHPLALLLLRLDPAPADEALRAAAQRLRAVLRTPDLVCHLGQGRLAALLPESSRVDAERLAHRVERMLATRIEGGARARVPVATVELHGDDDPVSLLERAEAELASATSDRELGRPPQSAVEPGS